MPVTKFDLKHNSEERTEFPPSYSGTYIATGEDDAEQVEFYAKAVLPPQLTNVYGQLWRQPLVTRRIGWKVYEVDASYGPVPWGPFQYTIRGRTTGGETQKILGSFQTIATSTDAPDFKGLIGYNPTDGTVEGTDVPVPMSELSIDIKAPAGYINLAYQDALAQLKGRVSSTTFLIWPAGEVRCEGTEYSATNADSEFTLNISIQKNLTSFVSAGLTIPSKQGWDFLWFLVEEKDVVAGAHTVKVKQAVHWYIERTLLRADFRAVLGFG
jgi:hypothetical protein